MVRVRLLFVAVAVLLSGATSALAAPIQFDLTINFAPQSSAFPSLTGDAQFYSYDPIGLLTAYNLVPPSPIDIGVLQPGSRFEKIFEPPDPCFADGSCGVAFGFGGLTGGFDAFAFVNFDSVPSQDPGSAPILPFGVLQPGDPCSPGDPCREHGLIVAFDDPETVGTFDIAISRVPEPGTLALFCAGLAILLGRLRRRRLTDCVQ